MVFLKDARSVPEFEHLIVYRCGCIKNIKTGKTLKPYKRTTGYAAIKLYKEGRTKRWAIHRLVMHVFLGPSALQVNHRDGNKLNNQLDNLEYITARENMRHARKLGLVKVGEPGGYVGSANGRAKLNEEQVQEIKRLLQQGSRIISLAKKYNVHVNTIQRIKSGKRWVHV